MQSYLIRATLIVLLSIAIFPNNVYAYINPGVGSIIFQIVVAFFITGLFLIGSFFKKIKSFFINLFRKKKNKP